MNRTITLALALVMVASLAALPLAAAGVGSVTHAQADEHADDQAANESATPGEQLSGVVGAQAAETDAEVADRTYGIQVANAATQEEAADVVGERLADVEERLTELEERKADLDERRDAGELTDGQYGAEMAKLAAETAAAERQAAQAAETAGGLDADVLEEAGVNGSAVEELRDRANELGGGEVAAIAQSIAGDSVGASIVDDREVGPPAELPREEPPRDGVDDDEGDGDDEGQSDDAGDE
ncbi:hypothetical protein [Halovivax sp.]|uniref:hypothetical protein n=1 Tax=Halovivax sp. TaxID=1935978 RepID=UPI0025C33C8C|nr:hypothetical protein [Halovivax sp.]